MGGRRVMLRHHGSHAAAEMVEQQLQILHQRWVAAQQFPLLLPQIKGGGGKVGRAGYRCIRGRLRHLVRRAGKICCGTFRHRKALCKRKKNLL